MRILALQLKRIGDLVLTTPALAALKTRYPEAELTLAVHRSTAGLLPLVDSLAATVVFGPGCGVQPWRAIFGQRYDAVLDFTGTDRSALATVCGRGREAIAFEWVRKNWLRARAYTAFVPSNVRERHTVDHYLDLLRPLDIAEEGTPPRLVMPAAPSTAPGAVVLHAGTARPEKYWLAERWSEVARHLIEAHGRRVILTTGPDTAERAHVEAIRAGVGRSECAVEEPENLAAFAGRIAAAPLVVSCDTAAVHLAAAYGRPQIALFGPTNPFHWRPRHPGAVVISAANPDAALSEFTPRMKGAPMERISTALVCRAIDALLFRDPVH